MAAPTVTAIITQIAPIAEVLASNDVANGALFGAPINPMWPLQIYVEIQSCLWRFNGEDISGGNTPSQTLVNNSNYLYSIICGKYGMIAQNLINPGGVIPTPGENGDDVFIGIAGRGIPDNDPAVDSSIIQSTKLIGLGKKTGGFIQIFVNSTPMQNFGNNPNFTYNQVDGIIDISPIELAATDSVYVDLKQ